MAELRLAKLPDRTPVKITIAVSPALNDALRDYAAVYRAAYGQAESVPELIPFMLDSFLAGDREFAKARKDAPREETADPPARRPRGAGSTSPPAEGGG
jgi:hypothetical protein